MTAPIDDGLDLPEFLMRRTFHPLAEIFPLIEGQEFDALVEDIRANGLHESIVLYQGKILDGRNRYRACSSAGIDPSFKQYLGDDPVAYVVSLNLKRRHLDESQRAMVAAKLATLKRGDNQHSPIGETSQAKAAELLNVGKRSVERAAEVRDRGAPELQHAVERGDVSVSAAADVATLSKDEQTEIVARGEKEILKAAVAIRARQTEVRHAKRIAMIARVSAGNNAIATQRKFPIILADPPWDFHLWNSDCDGKGAGQHYPTMDASDIAKLPISNIAADDAALFLWTTNAHLEQSFEVLKAWGFLYVTNIVWVKDGIGLGYWCRNQHELLLIGRRGDIPAPLAHNRPPSVIHADRREHSQKPDEAYALIEQMYPDLPKIELFARNARVGWDAWGNQAPGAAA